MPYKDIGAFRRAYCAEENSLAYKRSHNIIRDYQNLQRYRDELGVTVCRKLLKVIRKSYIIRMVMTICSTMLLRGKAERFQPWQVFLIGKA